jgi:hypothetical protein
LTFVIIMKKITCTDERGKCNGPFFEDKFLPALNKRFLSKANLLRPSKVVFDFDNIKWADLLEVLSIAGAMFHLSNKLDQDITFRVSEFAKTQDTVNRLNASGFFDLLRAFGIGVAIPDPETTSPYTFFRFTNINNLSEKEAASNLISKNVERYYPWLSEYQKLSFNKIVHEMLENSLEHAYGVPTSGIRPRMIAIRRFSQKFLEYNASRNLAQQSYWLRTLLRTMTGCDFLEIAIVDVGVGILGTIREELTSYLADKLRRHPLPSELNDLAALRFALSQHKSTSSSVREGKGFGLYKFQDHVQAWNGLFLLRSGRARVIQSPTSQARDEQPNLAFFPGTQIRVLLPVTERSMNVEYVLSKERDLK